MNAPPEAMPVPVRFSSNTSPSSAPLTIDPVSLITIDAAELKSRAVDALKLNLNAQPSPGCNVTPGLQSCWIPNGGNGGPRPIVIGPTAAAPVLVTTASRVAFDPTGTLPKSISVTSISNAVSTPSVGVVGDGAAVVGGREIVAGGVPPGSCGRRPTPARSTANCWSAERSLPSVSVKTCSPLNGPGACGLNR